MSNTGIYWNIEMENLLNIPQMREIQLAKLQKMLPQLYKAKPYWKERMDKAGLDPYKLKSLEEFSRKMPIMDKSQRRQIIVDNGGDVLKMAEDTMACSLDKVVLMAATSGTSGDPTPYPFTQNDIEVYSELFARMLWRIGVRPGNRIIHCFGLSMWMAGVPYVQFMQRVGACVLPVGAEGGTERILRFIRQFKPDTLFGTPSLVEHLIEKTPQLIGEPVGNLGIKRIVRAGEPDAGIPEVRNKIESAYGAKLFDHGGAMGASCEYSEYQGMHHLADDKYVIELVDPDTLEPIPFENGAQGMMVTTSLDLEGMLWCRETFGDIWQVFTDPCPCGQSGWRYKVIGRVDDMLKVKGVMVYPAAIDGVITSFAPRVTGEFRIVLDEEPPRVVPPLKLKVEYAESVKESELEGLANEITNAIHTKLRITPKISWVPPYSLERTAGKTKFIEKAYENK